MAVIEDQEWNDFISLIDEAKEFLLKAEQGEMCLDELKSLSDRGMAIMTQLSEKREEKNLQIVMLDINLMETLFKIFKLNVRTLSPDKFVFDPVIHAHKVLHMLGLKKESKLLGQSMVNNLAPVAARVFSHRAASLSVLSGIFEVSDAAKTAAAAALAKGDKPKVPQTRLPKDVIEPVKAPERISEVTGRTVEATLKVIKKQLEDAYKANKEVPLSYIKFAFHPDSFSKTVENIFHISFLVNNCIASIFLDSNGRPCIKPQPKAARERTREDKCALVMSITQDEWKEGVRLFGVTKPMIVLEETDIPGVTSMPATQKRKRRPQQENN